MKKVAPLFGPVKTKLSLCVCDMSAHAETVSQRRKKLKLITVHTVNIRFDYWVEKMQWQQGCAAVVGV